MPVFFTADSGDAAVGRTIALEDAHTQGTTSVFSMDPNISWQVQRSIITRITMAHQCNFQFLHSIGNDIYIYVFGDRIGQITVSGLSMTQECDSRDTEHGFEKIMRWYGENRVAARKTPIKLTIGSTPIEGFVVGLTGDLVDPSTRVIQYGLTLMVLPEKN